MLVRVSDLWLLQTEKKNIALLELQGPQSQIILVVEKPHLK